MPVDLWTKMALTLIAVSLAIAWKSPLPKLAMPKNGDVREHQLGPMPHN